jgi:hypothetical protein
VKGKTTMKSMKAVGHRRTRRYGEQAKDCSLEQSHAQFLCNAQEWRENNQASALADFWPAM